MNWCYKFKRTGLLPLKHVIRTLKEVHAENYERVEGYTSNFA